MLAANRAVAGYLLKRGIESLHRVHEKRTRAKFWNSKNWPAHLAIRSASKICIREKLPCVTAASPRPQKLAAPIPTATAESGA